MNYIYHLIILIEVYCILSLSLNVLVGFNGMLSFAQAAFYGIGAYITTYFVFKGAGFFPSILLAALIVGVVSVLISVASLRFKGDIFILVTLAFQTVFFSIVYNWVSVTKGPYGIPGIPKPDVFGDSLPKLVLLYGCISLLVGLFIKRLMKAGFCISLAAIRDNETAAISLGKNVFAFRLKSVAIAAAMAGIAGGMYASYITYIDPTSFSIDESILILSMLLIGGTGNIKGPIIGAVTLILLPEVLRLAAIPDSIAPNVRLIIYGCCLVLMMFFRPRGIAGQYRFE